MSCARVCLLHIQILHSGGTSLDSQQLLSHIRLVRNSLAREETDVPSIVELDWTRYIVPVLTHRSRFASSAEPLHTFSMYLT